jgi:hypothetical protein
MATTFSLLVICLSVTCMLTPIATQVFYPLFDDLGTPRWVLALGKAPAAIWNRDARGWLRPANGRRSPSESRHLFSFLNNQTTSARNA